MLSFSLISLGCTKNLVDSEVMIGLLSQAGMRMTPDPTDAEIVIVNTCGFLESARLEAKQTVGSVGRYKRSGKLRALIVTGCAPKFYREELARGGKGDGPGEFADADAFVGPGDILEIGSVVRAVLDKKSGAAPVVSITAEPVFMYDHATPRALSTARHSAYVKIAEGCSNGCAYCLIPSIRGAFRSRRLESVVKEARRLADSGVAEINLIAQDTTRYGEDLYGKRSLARLLEKLAEIRGLQWIRVLYAHPAHIGADLIAALKGIPKLCRYVDMPIQHIDDGILSAMRRKATRRDIEKLIDRLRCEIPGVALRTSVIVGLPGETEKAFESLLDFVTRSRFDRLGAFAYSREVGTDAHGMKGQVSMAAKKARLAQVMSAQQAISAEINRAIVGE
ncbi:MAG TPA: 30S ribosomal protein S12 methylthiotransferase RimO, partial [bacterium]|nr:30S ribosomal protein S12 methylthiotransferase RimO [bacterium]